MACTITSTHATSSATALLSWIPGQTSKRLFLLWSKTWITSIRRSRSLHSHSKLHRLQFPFTHTSDLTFVWRATAPGFLALLDLVLSYMLFLCSIDHSMRLGVEDLSLLSEDFLADFHVLWISYFVEWAAALLALLEVGGSTAATTKHRWLFAGAETATAASTTKIGIHFAQTTATHGIALGPQRSVILDLFISLSHALRSWGLGAEFPIQMIQLWLLGLQHAWRSRAWDLGSVAQATRYELVIGGSISRWAAIQSALLRLSVVKIIILILTKIAAVLVRWPVVIREILGLIMRSGWWCWVLYACFELRLRALEWFLVLHGEARGVDWGCSARRDLWLSVSFITIWSHLLIV